MAEGSSGTAPAPLLLTKQPVCGCRAFAMPPHLHRDWCAVYKPETARVPIPRPDAGRL
jgi:hypothetical protein